MRPGSTAYGKDTWQPAKPPSESKADDQNGHQQSRPSKRSHFPGTKSETGSGSLPFARFSASDPSRSARAFHPRHHLSNQSELNREVLTQMHDPAVLRSMHIARFKAEPALFVAPG